MSHLVQPLNLYLEKYATKHKIIVDYIQKLPIPLNEKLKMYEEERSKLILEFQAERSSEFHIKIFVGQQSHSCTKGSSGGTKDCGSKYVHSPHPGMKTRREWVALIEGQAKEIGVVNEGAAAYIYQSKSGRGRIAGTISATFKYDQDYIIKTVVSESEELFLMIGTEYDPKNNFK